jgi:hypothetical protein
VTARRIAAALLAASWAASAVLVGSLALHVALEHGHHGAAATAASSQAHAGIAELVEHGHVHAAEAGEHEHALALPVDLAARTTHAAAALPAPVREDSTPGPSAVAAPAFGSPLPPPPRACGPPLLALLATLRL